MKKSIYFEFIFGYIIYALIGIILIQTVGTNVVKRQVEYSYAKNMYDDANEIADRYYDYIYEKRDFADGFSAYLSSLRDYLNCRTIVVDTSGNITYASNINDVIYVIPDFEPSYFGNKFYKSGYLYGLTEDENLAVSVPIIKDYTVSCYIISYMDISPINQQTNNIINWIYFVFCLIFVSSLIILVLFTLRIYVPIKRLTLVSSEYAKGNFAFSGKKLPISNEIGAMAASIRYMGTKFQAMEDDEKKFIGNISHDFRSPLTSIKGYLEAMKDGTIPPEMYNKYFDIVLSETERLTKLTNNLLTLNVTENNGVRLDISNFDINQVLRDILLSFEGQCTKKDIMIDVTYGAKIYNVHADKAKIQQVIYNLVDNAIKFSHTDSTIYVKTSGRGEKIFISIKDSGIGIPKDCIPKIWNRFYKSDLSRGKDKTGTGLGLSIVKEVITAHNENINVISTEGVGTEFIFSLKRNK